MEFRTPDLFDGYSSRMKILFLADNFPPEKNARPADPGYRDYRIEAVAGRKTRDLAGGAR